jgi:toxin ParE1/3/4
MSEASSTYRVEEKLAVLEDYKAIARHVELWTGDRAMADRTVDAIRAFIAGLEHFPHRGTKRDDLRHGVRIVAAYRRTAVAIEIDDRRRVVTVLRVFYGGQDYETVMREPGR